MVGTGDVTPDRELKKRRAAEDGGGFGVVAHALEHAGTDVFGRHVDEGLEEEGRGAVVGARLDADDDGAVDEVASRVDEVLAAERTEDVARGRAETLAVNGEVESIDVRSVAGHELASGGAAVGHASDVARADVLEAAESGDGLAAVFEDVPEIEAGSP